MSSSSYRALEGRDPSRDVAPRGHGRPITGPRRRESICRRHRIRSGTTDDRRAISRRRYDMCPRPRQGECPGDIESRRNFLRRRTPSQCACTVPRVRPKISRHRHDGVGRLWVPGRLRVRVGPDSFVCAISFRSGRPHKWYHHSRVYGKGRATTGPGVVAVRSGRYWCGCVVQSSVRGRV